MNKIFYLLVAAGIVVIAGTVIMYNLEKGAENSQMTTLLDAIVVVRCDSYYCGIWRCCASYQSRKNSRISLHVFWYNLDYHHLTVISNTFYKKRFEKEETEKKKQDMNYLRNLVISKLADIERKQSECIETVNRLRSSIENK